MALRREIMSYIGTGAIGGIIGYYAGAQELLGIQSGTDPETGAPTETETSTETEATTERETPPETTTQTSGETVTEGFEDGTVSGWTAAPELASSFEASQQRAGTGSWSAKFTEGTDGDGTPEWQRVGNVVRPTTVTTAHALENGEIYADSFTEWRLDDTVVLRVNYNWSNNFAAVNGTGAQPSDIEQGAVVADLPWPSSENFIQIQLNGIDWDNNVVGEVRVNGTRQAEDVPFFNDADGIDRTTVFIAGNGGNIMYIDDTTIPEN